MGTNYYLRHKDDPPTCETCGHTPRVPQYLHIGKSSGGWCFSLHVWEPSSLGWEGDCYEWYEAGVVSPPSSLDEWEQLFLDRRFAIYDEYSRPITPAQMMETITQRDFPVDVPPPVHTRAFLERNHASVGPSGLLRHAGDPRGSHKVRHPPDDRDTYDLCYYEFS